MKALMRALLTAALVMVAGTACANPVLPHVAEVSSSVHPYIAYVAAMRAGSARYSCSGTVISAHWVLTAAHCVDNPKVGISPKTNAFIVQLGVDGAPSAPTYAVNRIVVEPRYQEAPAHIYDLALLYVAEELAAPPLPLARADPAPGAVVTLAGWGCIDRDVTTCKLHPAGLKTAETTVLSARECTLLYGSSVPTAQFCTSRPGQGSVVRQGDSGGAFMAKATQGYWLVGVVSTVNPSNINGFDLSAKLQRKWIRAVTGITPVR